MKYIYSIFVIFFVFESFLFSQNSIILTDKTDSYELTPYIQTFEDTSGLLKIEDVVRADFDNNFIQNTESIPNFGYSNSNIWVKFKIKKISNRGIPWILELDYAPMNYMDFYLVSREGEVISEKKSGNMLPFETRDFLYQNIVFYVTFNQVNEQYVYLRFKSKELMNLPLKLHSMTGFMNYIQINHIFNGILIGILVIMIGYNLFLYFSLKEISYIYLIWSISSLLFFMLTFKGLALQYLWPNAPQFNLIALPLFALLVLISFLRFTNAFFNLKNKKFILYRLNLVLTMFCAFVCVLSFALDYFVFIQLLFFATFIGLSFVIYIIISFYTEGFYAARFFLVSIVPLLLSTFYLLFNRWGLLPSTSYLIEGIELGAIWLVLFLSFAQADRVKFLKTEKDKARFLFKQSEKKFKKLFEEIPDAIFLSHTKRGKIGVIADVNPAAEKQTGYSRGELLGKNIVLDLARKKIDTEDVAKFEEKLMNGETIQFTEIKYNKDGSKYWTQIVMTAINIGTEKLILSINRDITEFKELQEQLMQSQKMESLGTLAGGIAHDFNNILTVINGYSDFALMEIDKKHPLYKNISAIKTASEKAAKLTKQILGFSRKQIFQPITVDINQVIIDLEKMIKRLVGEDINLSMNLSAGLSNIKADPNQIEQILLNLIVNARDAINQKTTKASQKSIIISTVKVNLDEKFSDNSDKKLNGPHICFAVHDSGVGISKELTNKVLEPFFTTKEKGKGTGLGLATVYGIVKQNHGDIEIISNKNEGTTINIYWPVTEDTIPERTTKDLKSREIKGKETILLVEDDKEILKYTKNVLSEFGYNIIEAENGKKAVELVKDGDMKPDMLITDMVMPEMNGMELSEKIVKILPNCKILYVSGYSDDHIIESGEIDKDLAFIQKPFNVKVLLEKIRDVMETK